MNSDSKTTTAVSVNAKIEISHERVSDLIVTAFEGSIGYWAARGAYVLPNNPTYKPDAPKYSWVPVNDGGSVEIYEMDENGGEGARHILDLAACKRGLQLMADRHSRHFDDVVNGTFDATTADVFIQLAVLGEIVYS